MVDIFDREAIRRKIYQLHEVKEYVTTKKLVLYNRTSSWLSNYEMYCVIHNISCFMKRFTVCCEENITITTAEQNGGQVMQGIGISAPHSNYHTYRYISIIPIQKG